MFKSRPTAFSAILTFGTLMVVTGLSGCQKSDSIEKYTVKKHDALQTSAYLEDRERRHPQPKRMVGAIIPKGPLIWFLKMDGSDEAVLSREGDVREFLKTLRFPDPEKIEWILPAGWKELPANEFRYATLVLDGEPALEMSVTKLPFQTDMELDQQILSNVNRWRGQYSLPGIAPEDLASEIEKIDLKEFTAYWVNLYGRPKPRPQSMQPLR